MPLHRILRSGFMLGASLALAVPSLAPVAAQSPSAPAAPVAPGSSAAPAGSPGAGRVVALELTANLEITQDGTQVKELDVAPGETITFHITNTAGFDHSFYIGPEAQLQAGDQTGLPGVGPFTSGEKDFTWTVPADVTGLVFACTVPGHYTLMHGTFVAGG